MQQSSSAAILSGAFDKKEVLLGYQKRWIADDSPLKIAQKSRRTGLTWAQAADDALDASKSPSAGGTNCFYVGSQKEMAREYIDAVAMWAKAYDKACSEIGEEVLQDGDKDILTFVVYFASGYKVQALSSRPSNLRGMQGNVTIDEAAFHEHLAEVLKAALALTMWGAKVRLISTHNGVANLFNQLIQDSLAGKKRYSVHTITLDDACRDGLYKRICQVKRTEWSQTAEDEWKAGLLKDTATEDDALEEYYCVPKQSGGQYLPRLLIESAMQPDIPILYLEAPKGFLEWTNDQRAGFVGDWLASELDPLLDQLSPELSHAFGEDFARKGDLTVLAPLEIGKDLQRRVPFLVELRMMTYDQQRQIVLHIMRRLPRLSGAAFDATGNGGYLAEAAALTFGTDLVEQVMLNDPWYREWMPKFKSGFEDGLITIPRHQDILDDLSKIQTINGVPKIDRSKNAGGTGQRHGDSAIALAMAWRASLMDGYAIEYTALPKSTSRWDGAASRNFNRPDDDDDYPISTKGGW
ncbi:hypothetical protein KDN34_02965 [Shewanella yunxiaonensis]|uniref:Mu-like prophage FluMu protein gp28 n=1 Tax=Shewanella yunxiaonensis TaxID=2829809 RepID=A0ABX7YZ13_9GAMM|nr:hypothetical protein KDN34_02965 [Shewanella yunxiaonensis]